MKKSIRFIYFDVGGVLLDFRSGHKRAAEKYGVPYEAVQSIFEANWQAACRGTLSNDAYMALFANLFHIVKPYPHLADFWTDHFSPIPATHAFVKSLAGSYMLGLLSNAEQGAMYYARKKKLVPDIDWACIVDSSEHNTIKPEPKIYEIAETMAGVAPEQILFIDDVPIHIDVARSRGWQGVVFDANHLTKSIHEISQYLKIPVSATGAPDNKQV